ncbi:MAG: hypothetical protein AVDCRST_MAG58-448 [uncultured Rubrobacteraceae bacterium]|uniref:Guanylate cyclase domain-containing protein n=1 Tax=uncultured Rubrobacteraceae bacterium TaxID=349277 RepID=A0A6J4QMF6_9ACTN|nr:MAG: hypothetical protein AVDCRST_MAG58-448 [uncultured Rubrobacteraceae bacterium]
MANSPTGTVTFLFTDIDGSTSMWERDAAAMRKALARHDEILRSTIETHGGYIYKTIGDRSPTRASTESWTGSAASSATLSCRE